MMREKLKNRELSIGNLFWSVCFKWKQIIIIGLVCAVLAGGVSYFIDAKSIKSQMKEGDNSVIPENFGLGKDLSETVNLYLRYYAIYKEQEYYNDNSPFMQLNANGFYKGEVIFYVNNHYEVEYPLIDKNDTTYSIVSAYQSLLTSKEFTKEVARAMDIQEEDYAFASDLIDSSNRLSNANSVTKDFGKGVFIICVYAKSEEKCERFREIIANTIEGNKDHIESQYGAHDLLQVSNNGFYTSDPYILQLQRDQIDRMKDYYSRMSDLEKQFSEAEKMYVQAYKKQQYTGEEQSSDITENSRESAITPTVNKKMVAIVFIGAMFVTCVCFALAYILNTCVRVEDRPEETFGIAMIGMVLGNYKSMRGIDGFVQRNLYRKLHLCEKDVALDLLKTNIKVLAKKKGIRRLYVNGAACSDKERHLFDDIAEQLKKSDIIMEYGNSILLDAEAFEKSSLADAIIVAVCPGKTSYYELAEILDLCTEQKTSIMGLVMINA